MTDMDISLPEPDGLMHYVLLNGRRPSAWSEDQVRAIVAAEVAEEREWWREIAEQLIACHDEPTCPAVRLARERLAAIRKRE